MILFFSLPVLPVVQEWKKEKIAEQKQISHIYSNPKYTGCARLALAYSEKTHRMLDVAEFWKQLKKKMEKMQSFCLLKLQQKKLKMV